MIDLYQFAIVDTETDRLPPGQQPWEIAVLTYGIRDWREEVIHIIDYDESTMTEQSAAINGFHRRFLVEDDSVRCMTKREACIHLERVLAGKRIVGSNPGFDTDALMHMGVVPVWNHSSRDIPSMFLGAFGYEVRGLQGVCDALEITNSAPHTALGDARATRDAFMDILSAVSR